MKAFISFLFVCLIAISSYSQPEDVKTMHETAKNFMRTGDFDNAILVLTRALQQDKNSLELQKDLVMSYYLKRDYKTALDGVEKLVDRDDADVVTFQIAGNVYKALEEVKDCEKIYKQGLKKFPRSGPIYSEYGELLWAVKDFSAIDQWEKGIEVDPGYGGNYYNAALYYFYTKDKVWSLIYGEIFINMESLGERSASMKQLLLQGYKEKLFAVGDLASDQNNSGNKPITNSEFAKAYLSAMSKQASLASRGITTETLTMIRARFILDWFESNNTKYPFRLFDYQQQLLQEGMFDAYNHWLFEPTENLAAYDNWTKTHAEEYNAFDAFQKSRVFKMPSGQYYQAK